MADAARGDLLEACAGRPAVRTPIWLMRQAGRILPEYRQLRSRYESVGPLFETPELAARITAMPVEQLGVDAAILFTDLVTPLKAVGVEFAYAPGPVLARPLRTPAELASLPRLPVEGAVGFVLEAVRMARAALPAGVPLIGYTGAPFTLAAWLVEGSGPQDCQRLRRLMGAEPAATAALLARLGELAGDFACAQVEAGAQVIQVFDTSVGVLSAAQFERHVLPCLRSLFARLAAVGVPRIYFALAAPHLLPWLPATGASVLSLDWRTPLREAYARYGPGLPLQGNLDPCLLFAAPDTLEAAVADVLAAARGKPHIFNLGHGVLPETPLEAVRRLVDRVHAGAAADDGRPPDPGGSG